MAGAGRLKQFKSSFDTAKKNYNNKKVALANEYSRLMGESAKEGDWEHFDRLASDLVKDLGEAYELTKFSLEEAYKRPKS